MVIDNFDIIKSSLMNFEEKDNLFMHLQILRRGKDHPDLPAANKLIKSWLVRSREHLDMIREEVVFLCEHYKARAYISCAPKSIAKLNTLILRKLADNLHTDNIINPWHVFNSACGELAGVEKRWVMDVDDQSQGFEVACEIDRIWSETHPNLTETDVRNVRQKHWLIETIPTLNGLHLIARPFNLQEFKKKFPDVEAKKNGLTALYVPECIANQKSDNGFKIAESANLELESIKVRSFIEAAELKVGKLDELAVLTNLYVETPSGIAEYLAEKEDGVVFVRQNCPVTVAYPKEEVKLVDKRTALLTRLQDLLREFDACLMPRAAISGTYERGLRLRVGDDEIVYRSRPELNADNIMDFEKK